MTESAEAPPGSEIPDPAGVWVRVLRREKREHEVAPLPKLVTDPSVMPAVSRAPIFFVPRIHFFAAVALRVLPEAVLG